MQDSNFVFISYSRKNKEIVEEIIGTLEKNGINVYVDYRDIPPGAVFADEIVNAIETCLCCLLMYTDDSNNSGYVLSEMNSAVNHNKVIIPIRLDLSEPQKGLEFYIGKNSWVDYIGPSSLDPLIKSINSMKVKNQSDKKIVYDKPVVLDYIKLDEIGYNTERRVIETIEIDYRTLGEAPSEYSLTEDTEGTIYDWLDYVNNYPNTALYLVAKDRIVGYCQIELITEENYSRVISGQEMITSQMEEFYGFGGDFCCYIAIMPILKEYESQNNYILLFDELIKRIVEFSKDDVHLTKFGISVYTPLLEKMVCQLGFRVVGTNPVGGKIMELSVDQIRSNPIYRKRYPAFFELYEKGE